MNIQDKRTAGGLIINSKQEIFLGLSPKWHAWVVPGGQVEEGETDEEAFLREIQEELGVTVTIVKRLGEKIKEPSDDFHKAHIRFHFVDFLATIEDSEIPKIHTNDEISEHGWFTIQQALELELVDSTRHLILQADPFITVIG